MVRSEQGDKYQQWKLQNIDQRHQRKCETMERSSHDPGAIKLVSWKCLCYQKWFTDSMQLTSKSDVILQRTRQRKKKKPRWVYTWNYRRAQRATASLRREAWLEVLWLWLQSTLQRHRQIQQTYQTGRPAEQNKETNKGVKIRSWIKKTAYSKERWQPDWISPCRTFWIKVDQRP